MTAEITADRTFEHFRTPQTAGIGGLGTIGTIAMFAAAVVGIVITVLGSIVYGLVFGAFAGLALMAMSVRDRHGVSVLERGSIRLAHLRATRTGATLYRSGPVSRLGSYQLPGVLAQTELTEWEDAQGNPFALVFTPRPNHYAVTIECHPDGASLIDADDAAAMVDRWGEWLSFLAFEPSVLQAMVTIETAPDDGHGLRGEISSTMSQAAPDLARQVLGEIAESYPLGSATVRSWVTITFDGVARKRARDADAMGAALSVRLPEIVAKLTATGAGMCSLVDAQSLCQAIRVAYDPAAAGIFAAASATGERRPWMMRWDSIGPPAADNAWAYYRHASGVSVSWSMTNVLGRVNAEGLAPLLRPHPAISRKRVSLIYEIRDPGKAPQVAAADVKAAESRVELKRKPTAADKRDVHSAEATADEQAHGHGLVDFAIVVTATVRDVDDVPAAVAAIDSLGPAARLQLRREDGGHAPAFAQGLPGVGLITGAHSIVPLALREKL